MYTVALFMLSLAVVVQGRHVQTSFAQESTNPVSADPTVAFVPSGSALGHQRSIIPQSNLHSILANVAKKRIPSTGAAKPHRAGMFQMSAAEPRPGPAGMYDKAVALGAKKALLPVKKMLAMGVASGAHIALGAFLAVSVGGSCPGIKETDPGLQRALLGMFGLPMGLLMTVAAGGELVTGNFAVITAAWLEGKATLKKLCKNWITVIFANLLGSLLLAWFAFIANTGVGAGAVAIATAKCAAPFSAALVKGILCNWLVCMAVWMATSTADLGAKALAVFFPITGFVALGLEHCVANMFLLPFGMLSGAQITIADIIVKNLIPVTLGNMIGGAVFVAWLYKVSFGIDKPSVAGSGVMSSSSGLEKKEESKTEQSAAGSSKADPTGGVEKKEEPKTEQPVAGSSATDSTKSTNSTSDSKQK